MNHEATLGNKDLDRVCNTISQRVIEALISMTTLPDDETPVPYNNVWEAICHQLKQDLLPEWESYEDTVFAMIFNEVKKESAEVKEGIWSLTKEGISWLKEFGVMDDQAPISNSDLADYILHEYVYYIGVQDEPGI